MGAVVGVQGRGGGPMRGRVAIPATAGRPGCGVFGMDAGARRRGTGGEGVRVRGFDPTAAPSSLQVGLELASAAALAAYALMTGPSGASSGAPPSARGEEGLEAWVGCGGSGYSECLCTRWSDGDSASCPTCRGSGRSVCERCRGGGTMSPVFQPIRVRIKDAPGDRR